MSERKVSFFFTSDLHIFELDDHTSERRVSPSLALLETISRHPADALLIGGDTLGGKNEFSFIAHFLYSNFSQFMRIGLIPGNHDLWKIYWDADAISEIAGFDVSKEISDSVFDLMMPRICSSAQITYLENENIQIDDVLFIGTIGWYDYSYKNKALSYPDEYYAFNKSRYNNDGSYIKSRLSDKEFAERCLAKTVARLTAAEMDDSIDSVVVITHVPVFEEHTSPKSISSASGLEWEIGSAYFYNLTLGREIKRFPKVKTVFSGHTHSANRATIKRGNLPDIVSVVCGSDYHNPKVLEASICGGKVEVNDYDWVEHYRHGT